MKDLNKIMGALYGVAVGDALGAPLEFMKAEEIHGTVRDMIGGGRLNVRPGEVTDDTQMTLAVAWGIVENPEDPVPGIGQNFVRWYDSKPKDIGGTCRAAIALAKEKGAKTQEDWIAVGRKIAERNNHRSGGNGALMRTVYTGLYYDNPYNKTRDIARMTHDDDISTEICCTYAELVSVAVKGENVWTDLKEWMEEIDTGDRPSGWSKDSMSCAVRSILETGSFEDAVVRAVNLGGDADTIGAITGGLAGAIYGFDAIPDRWWSTLDKSVTDQLDSLAVRACD